MYNLRIAENNRYEPSKGTIKSRPELCSQKPSTRGNENYGTAWFNAKQRIARPQNLFAGFVSLSETTTLSLTIIN
jgi:hypothetical protein